MRRFLAILLLVWAVPCAARDEVPGAVISVLVDLSATWHNPRSTGYNAGVLKSVGATIAQASIELPKPVSVRFHVIGKASLARPPICRRDFRPSLLGLGASATTEIKPKAFRDYLTGFCPDFILHQPPEPETEISAAILTALEATAMVSRGTPRILIILSDFKEDTKVRYQLGRADLTGARAILLYRTLPEDRANIAGQRARVQYWRRLLERHGAKVSDFADSTPSCSPAEFETLIEGDD